MLYVNAIKVAEKVQIVEWQTPVNLDNDNSSSVWKIIIFNKIIWNHIADDDVNTLAANIGFYAAPPFAVEQDKSERIREKERRSEKIVSKIHRTKYNQVEFSWIACGCSYKEV